MDVREDRQPLATGDGDRVQAEVAAFLADPASHGVAKVERIDTHASIIFLAGERVYKVKRAVRFPYLDYSTLGLRRACCEREVALNRHFAPDLYLGVEAVRRSARGSLCLGGEGKTVEWAVVMRRFGARDTFDTMAEDGRLSEDLVVAAIDQVAECHAKAEIVTTDGDVARIIAQNTAALVAWPDVFRERDQLGRATVEAHRRLAALLEERRAQGWVRRCHGDLHLRNICLFDGRPTLFDAIEFDDALSCTDVYHDLAFLLMDLDHRRLGALANLALNRYLERQGDYRGLQALPLFLSLRAAVRAVVGMQAAAHQAPSGRRRAKVAARAYFDAAREYLVLKRPCLIAIGGLSGSGKTSLARCLAPAVGNAPGAVHLRSDVVRKRLMGTDPLTRLPPEAYTGAVSERVFTKLRTTAREVLSAGHAVVLDAVYTRPDRRRELAALARELDVPFHGFWLEAPADTLIDRVSARTGDASDATADVVRSQLGADTGPMTWHRLDATLPMADLAARAAELMGAHLAPEESP